MKSAVKPAIDVPAFPDRILEVPTEASYTMVRRLAMQEAPFVGVSSGSAAIAGLRAAAGLTHGCVATRSPDGGHKYLIERAFWDVS
jgi:cysteine synthase B